MAEVFTLSPGIAKQAHLRRMDALWKRVEVLMEEHKLLKSRLAENNTVSRELVREYEKLEREFKERWGEA